MIRFALKCAGGHAFDSWFQSGEAFDALLRAGHVSCPECGSSEVEKSLMAPRVRPSRKTAKPRDDDAEPVGPASAPAPGETVTNVASSDLKEALRRLRDHVEKTSDYVGSSFAAEARAMHLGDVPDRPIYGETTPDEARSLAEDGIPALPLPFIPRRKTN